MSRSNLLVSSGGRSSRSLPGRAALLSAPLRVVAVNLSSHTDPAAAHGLAGRLVADCIGLVADRVTQWTMAAKEDLYSKILPRRLRQNRPGSVKCGSNLDVLLSMGFPRPRA